LTDGVVRLRVWEAADAPAVLAACQDPDVQQFTRIPVPYHREHADAFIALSRQEWLEGVSAPFAVTDVTGRRLWGACGLHHVDRVTGAAEVGYWVVPAARGRGVARAALVLITGWGLGPAGLRRIYAKVEERNTASVAVAVGAGYRQVAGRVEYVELKGSTRAYREFERVASDLSESSCSGRSIVPEQLGPESTDRGNDELPPSPPPSPPPPPPPSLG
jgi:RimJ/RimL family protein N-acetyltransferase